MRPEQRRALAAQIRDRRKERGLSQEQLAVLSGVSLRAIQNAESGKNTPQEGNLLAMMDALGMSPDAEATRKGYPPDVQVFLDVIGAWLSAMDEPTRLDKIRDLTVHIVGGR